MAEALMAQGADLVLGDLIRVGVAHSHALPADIGNPGWLVAPLWFSCFQHDLPNRQETGRERRVPEKFAHFYRQAEIIAEISTM